MPKKSVLTKKDIDLLLESFKSVFLTKSEFDDFKEKLDVKLTKHRNDLIDHLDHILKEVTASREEQTIIGHQITDARSCYLIFKVLLV